MANPVMLTHLSPLIVSGFLPLSATFSFLCLTFTPSTFYHVRRPSISSWIAGKHGKVIGTTLELAVLICSLWKFSASDFDVNDDVDDCASENILPYGSQRAAKTHLAPYVLCLSDERTSPTLNSTA